MNGLAFNIGATRSLIDDDPTVVTLIPRIRTVSAAGTATYTDGPARPPQTVKLSLLAFDQRATATVAGIERILDYHMITMPDAEASVGDRWTDGLGTRYEVQTESEGWGYMRKFVCFRHVDRNGKP